MTAEMPKVVITGYAMQSPVGATTEDSLHAWRHGIPKYSRLETQLRSADWTPYAGVCQRVDTSLLPDRKVQKAITRKDLIGLTTALAAARTAGVIKGAVNAERFGMYVGAGSTQIGDLEPYFPLIAQCVNGQQYDAERFGDDFMSTVNPMVMLQTLMNNTLCYTCVALDIRGVNANFMDYQISGLRAVMEGYHAIRWGRADIILAGGVAPRPEPFHADQGIAMGYLAKTDICNDDSVGGVVKPYDSKRAGTILSEGSAFVVLESETHALHRGATILGYVNASALCADGGFAFLKKGKSEGLARALDACAAEAWWQPKDLAFIHGHGNGSLHGDAAEIETYAAWNRGTSENLWVHSHKGVFGEMNEASGVASLILSLEALRSRLLPATHNFKYGDDVSSLMPINAKQVVLEKQKALITTRSFSGISCCVALST